MAEEALTVGGAAAELLDLYWAPKPAPFSRSGLMSEILAAVAFLGAAVAALLVIDDAGRASAIDIALLMGAYVAATQVRFEMGSSFVLPTELALVPLLFLAPLGLVPLLVAGGMLLGTAVGVVRGRLPCDRMVSAVADGWHVIGPVVVLAVAGAPAPSLGDWPLYVAVFATQIVVEGVALSLREWVDRGVPLVRHVMGLGEGHVVDALLFPAGLLAAGAGVASGDPRWALLTVPFTGLLGLIDRERRQRIRISQTRLMALERERARGEAALERVGEAMSARLRADALLNLALRSALEAVGADGAAVVTTSGPVATVGQQAGAIVERVLQRVLARGAPAQEASEGSAAMAAPLTGLLTPAQLVCTRSGPPFSAGERHRLLTLVAQLGSALQLAAAHERMREHAETDHLTGLANHRRFQEVLAHAVERHRLTRSTPGLVLLDLDDFKRINDTHGHQTGDRVLQAVGRLLRSSCRPEDQPARYGGEELVVVIGDTTPEAAIAFGQRLCAEIARLRVTTDDGVSVPVTASLGLAVMGGGIDTPTALIAAADAALYRAKRTGKNRVVLDPHPDPAPAVESRSGAR